MTSTLQGGLRYEVARVTAAWTETSLTRGSQPATTGATTTGATGAGWATWTVTAQVAGREGGDPPELVVQWR